MDAEQEQRFRFRARLEAEQAQSAPEVSNASSMKPETAMIPQGTSGAEGVARGFLPRSFKAAEQDAGPLRLAGAGALDALSAPGRIVGSLNAPDAKTQMQPMGPGGTMIPVQPDAVTGRQGSDNGMLNAMTDTEGKGWGQRILRDPALLPSIATGGAIAKGAVGMGLSGLRALSAAGAVAGAQSGAIHQTDNAVQGKEVSPLAAAGEVAAGAAIPFAAKGVGMGVSAVNKGLGKLAQEFSGVSEEALRKFGLGGGQGAKDLAAAAGKQHEIGQKLVNVLDNLDDYLPEKNIVDQALQNMPPVSIENTVATLERSKTSGVLGSSRAVNDKIDGVISDLHGAADDYGMIPADKFRTIRKEVDGLVGDAFGKESGNYVSALKQARYQMADDLTKSAEASGVPEYADAMKSMAQKLQTADKLKAFLGKSAQTRDARAESFVSTLFGKNKQDRLAAVKGMEDLFGGDFTAEAKLSSLAAELGDDGKAGMLPRQFTGRAALGPAVAAVGGHFIAPGAAGIPLALSSPRIAAGILAGTGAADRFVGRGISAMEGFGVPGATNAASAAPVANTDLADNLAAIRKPMDMNQAGPEGRKVFYAGSRRPLPLQFGKSVAPEADLYAHMMGNTQNIPQSSTPAGMEGLMSPQRIAESQQLRNESLDALARQDRPVRVPQEPIGGNLKVLSASDVSLRPRTPTAYIPSNFPPPNLESPAIAKILNESGRRPIVLNTDRISSLNEALARATTKEQKASILKLIRDENYKIPLRDLQ